MTAKATSVWLGAAVVSVFGPSTSSAISLSVPGYSAKVVATLPHTTYGDLEVDQAGNLLFAAGNQGVLKVTGGTVSTWSSAKIFDLALAPLDSGYGAAPTSNSIYTIQPNGAFEVLHQDALQWSHVAIQGDSLFASTASSVRGMYRVDTDTGVPSVIVAGGPGPGGVGAYRAMAFGADGKLYTLGTLDGLRSGDRLFRLDGNAFTIVAAPTDGGDYLALGPDGVFLVTTSFDHGSGYPRGELWLVDPTTGASTLLASSGSYPGMVHPTFGAVGYNSTTKTIYVAENWQIWAITKDGSAVVPESWGRVKEQYRK